LSITRDSVHFFPVYMERSCPRWRVPPPAKLPRASQLSRHFLIKLGEPLTLETKGCLCRFTLFRWHGHPPSRANFSACKHFGSPSRVNSVKVRQSEHTRELLARAGDQLFSHIDATKVGTAARLNLFLGTTFLHINGALACVQSSPIIEGTMRCLCVVYGFL